jgi:hypothetical protein
VNVGDGIYADDGILTAPCGDPIEDVVYTAAEGYYFPEDYSAASVMGITVTRLGYNAIKLHGIPSADCEITLPSATPKQKHAMPLAAFEATGAASGTLFAANTDWVYSLDGGNTWLEITSDIMSIAEVDGERGILVKHSLFLFGKKGQKNLILSTYTGLTLGNGRANSPVFPDFVQKRN